MAILVTGASGFIGSVLTQRLLAKGEQVYALSRHPPSPSEGLWPLVGDITKPNLGLIEMEPLKDITVIYHLAGIHTLQQEDKDGSIWNTNVEGTRNVLKFCISHHIPRLYFASTAYTWPVNPYGMSKMQNEDDLGYFAAKHGLKVTIFKPSIVLGNADHPYPGHFSRFIRAIIDIHKRADLIRRKVEGTLRLPVLEPVFRVNGNPEGKVNLIQIDEVAWGMAEIDELGTFWLTQPSPPTLAQVAEWVGEFIMLNLKFVAKPFKRTPIEAAFHKLATPFQPYLKGDNFPSNLQLSPPISREVVHDIIRNLLD